MPGFFVGAVQEGRFRWCNVIASAARRSRSLRLDIECNAVFFCEGVIGANLDGVGYIFGFRSWEDGILPARPRRPRPPTCFALCSSLSRSFLQTHDDPGAIRRPASVPLPRRPVSVVCSFLKVPARNRRTKNQKHRARTYCTESLNSYIFSPSFPRRRESSSVDEMFF